MAYAMGYVLTPASRAEIIDELLTQDTRRNRKMTVGIFEARQKLSQLVARAAKGEEIVITRRGKEQARLVSLPAERGRTLKEILDSIRSQPRIKHPKGVTIKSLIEGGR